MNTVIVYLIVVVILGIVCVLMSRQLGRPSGWFGRRVMGSLLNTGNQRFLESAVGALSPRSGERIVDVGFGGGYALELIRPLVAPARPAGVEISAVMVEQGRQRWGDAVDLHLASVESMPFGDGSVDGLVSVNTLYFWPDPSDALREMRRVLRAHGRLVLGVRRKAVMLLSPFTWFGFRLYSVRQLDRLLREAGFDVTVSEKTRGELILECRPL